MNTATTNHLISYLIIEHYVVTEEAGRREEYGRHVPRLPQSGTNDEQRSKAVEVTLKNAAATVNIRKHFRSEFDKGLSHTDQEKIDKFQDGIIRLLSNYMLHNIKQEYKENPEKFRRNVEEDDLKEAERDGKYELYDR